MVGTVGRELVTGVRATPVQPSRSPAPVRVISNGEEPGVAALKLRQAEEDRVRRNPDATLEEWAAEGDRYLIDKHFAPFLEAFAETSPEDGLAFILEHDVGVGHLSDVKHFFKTVAETDVVLAAQLFDQLPPGSRSETVAPIIARQFAAHDLGAAVDWAASIADEAAREKAIAGLQ